MICDLDENIVPNEEAMEAVEQPTKDEEVKLDAVQSTEEESPAAIEQPAPEEQPVAEAEQEVVTQETTAEEQVQEEQPIAEETAPTFEIPQTTAGIMERMEHLAEHPEQSERLEIAALKKAFYRLHLQAGEQTEETQASATEGTEKPEQNEQQAEKLIDEMTQKFQSLLKQIKDLRAKLAEDAEQQKLVNVEKRKQIVEKIRELLESPDKAAQGYQTFRALQEEWKAAKPVPQQSQNELWRNYQFVTEQFYDLLKENNALRDYDLKKNLEKKTAVCEETERLAQQISEAAEAGTLSGNKLIAAVNTLQHMHDAYREIGPVEKSKREDLWNRFKTASSVINRLHAKYFESAKQQEKENLQKKTALCESVENIETEALRTYGQWNKATLAVQQIQADWRGVGRASRKQNQQIYDRFRAACDKFFEARNAYFKQQKREFAENTQKKLQLCEAAEALKESEDWQSAAAELRKLQKEWKEVGPVAHKNSNALWERFNGACNYFFGRMKEANPYGAGGRRGRESRRSRDMAPLTPSEALQKKYQQLKSELQTFENNIAFLTTTSKSGNALIDQMKQKIESLKAELAAVESRIREPEAPAEAPTETPATE